MKLVTAANNREIFIAATKSKADAIYLPITGFTAIRWGCDFFDLADVPDLVSLAHDAGKKVYPVINGHPREHELKNYKDAAYKIYQVCADGIVLGAPELIEWAGSELADKESFALIVSSSARVINYDDIVLFTELGANRIILSRLHTLSDVSYLAANSNTQIELFVYGLVCPAWEGHDCRLPDYAYKYRAGSGSCVSQDKSGLAFACGKYTANNGSAVLWNPTVQADIFLLSEIVNTNIYSIKVIPATKNIRNWKKIIAIWKNALDEAVASNSLTDNNIKNELTGLCPFETDFYLRDKAVLCA